MCEKTKARSEILFPVRVSFYTLSFIMQKVKTTNFFENVSFLLVRVEVFGCR